jgi:hypothetical protein
METPEARTKSAELHQMLLEEQKLKNPSVEGEDEDEEDEGDVDENEDLSSGDEEIQVGGEKNKLCNSDKCFTFQRLNSFVVIRFRALKG